MSIPTMSPSHRNTLRRSCDFCRLRKAKCSGESRCSACRKQKIDCIYQIESHRARSISQQTLNGRGPDSRKPSPPPTHAQTLSCDAGLTARENMPSSGEVQQLDVASQLDDLFQNTYHWSWMGWQTPDLYRKSNHHSPADPITFLIHDLAGLLITKSRSLAFQHNENETFGSFASDMSETMFTLRQGISNPLAEYDTRRMKQLIDVWYSTSPLRMLVSKTLLLRDLRNKTQDDVLLAIILAEAISEMGDTFAADQGKRLLDWAVLQLLGRTIGCPNLSTAQSLALLGWSSFREGKVRRALCLFELANHLVLEIKGQMLDEGPESSSRINGIDIAKVDTEITSHLWWISFSFGLWASMQMEGSTSKALSNTAMYKLFPIDPTLSAMIKLDQVSDNLSTLHMQKASVREMWPLAKISFVAASISSHFPQEPSQMLMESIKALKSGLSDRARHHCCSNGAAFQGSRKKLETLLECFDQALTYGSTFNSQLEPQICSNQPFTQQSTDALHKSEQYFFPTPQVSILSPPSIDVPNSVRSSKRMRTSRDSSYASSNSQSPSQQRAEAPFFSPLAISEPVDNLQGFAYVNQSWDASFDGLAFGVDGFYGGGI